MAWHIDLRRGFVFRGVASQLQVKQGTVTHGQLLYLALARCHSHIASEPILYSNGQESRVLSLVGCTIVHPYRWDRPAVGLRICQVAGAA